MSKQVKHARELKDRVLTLEGSHLDEPALAELVAKGAVAPEELRAATREASVLERKHYAKVYELRQRLAGQLLLIDAGLERWRNYVDNAHVCEHATKLAVLAEDLAAYLQPMLKPKRKAS